MLALSRNLLLSQGQAHVSRGSLLCEAKKYISKFKIHVKEIVLIITNIQPYIGPRIAL